MRILMTSIHTLEGEEMRTEVSEHRHAFCRTANIAILALEKIRQRRPLDVRDEAALLSLDDELAHFASEKESLEDELILARRLSSSSGTARDDMFKLATNTSDEVLPDRTSLNDAIQHLGTIRHDTAAARPINDELITHVQKTCLRLLKSVRGAAA